MRIKTKIKTFVIHNFLLFTFILTFIGLVIFKTYLNYSSDKKTLNIAKSITYIVEDLQKERLYAALVKLSNQEKYKEKYKRVIKKFNKDVEKLRPYFYASTGNLEVDELISKLLRAKDILPDIRKNVLELNLYSIDKIEGYYTDQINTLIKLLNRLKLFLNNVNLLKEYDFTSTLLFYKESFDEKDLKFLESLLKRKIDRDNLLLYKGKTLGIEDLLKLEASEDFLNFLKKELSQTERYLSHIEDNILRGNIKNISLDAYVDLIDKKDFIFSNIIEKNFKKLDEDLRKDYFSKLFILSLLFLVLLAFVLFGLIVAISIKKKFDFYISEVEYVLDRISKADYKVRLHKISDDEISELITKINKILCILERSLKRLKESTLKEKIMISSMSHEIKNTLNATIGYLELLELSSKLDGRERLFLKNALEACKLSLENLEEILDYHKITLGKANIEYEPINLEELVKEAVALSSVKIKPSNIKIKYKNLESVPLVYGPKKKILQILINLITNAIKYTFSGFVEIGVKEFKKLDEDNALLVLYVKDTGVGIPDRIKDKIFKVPFLRENIDTKLPSTGLGLYITKKFVDFIGGKIYFESQKGKGTTFYVEIPVKFSMPKKDLEKNKNSLNDTIASSSDNLFDILEGECEVD